MWKIPAGSVAVFATQAGIAFIISAFARRRGVAAGVYIGFTIISGGVAFGLAETVNRWFAVIDLQAHAIVLIGKIFGERNFEEGTALAENNISPWVSLVAVDRHRRRRRGPPLSPLPEAHVMTTSPAFVAESDH